LGSKIVAVVFPCTVSYSNKNTKTLPKGRKEHEALLQEVLMRCAIAGTTPHKGHPLYLTRRNRTVKVKSVVLLLLVVVLGLSLVGCGCFRQAVKGETPPPPPPKAEPAPPPPKAEPAPPKASKTMVFEEAVLFDFDKADLKPGGKEQIKKYREQVQAEMSRADKIKITGHTDSTGATDYNKKLSLRRAQTVSDYLVSLGADPSKMEVSGEGEANPIADNKTKEGRAKNRRVEVDIIGLGK
jgi:outer membrane protein OmpA-like peptidoglycan-associated protein